MTNAAPPLPRGVTDVPPEVENQNIKDIAIEFAHPKDGRLMKDILAAFPDFVISPAVKLPPRERLMIYMQKLGEAYPTDEYARTMELAWLLNQDYLALIREGVAPPPISRPWAKLVVLPPVFEEVQRLFRQDYKAVSGRLISGEAGMI